MKRDMELIRLLLLEIECEGNAPDLSESDDDKIIYHKALLVESGLVHGEIIIDGNGSASTVIIFRLTWAGHDFLDAARSQSTWNKTTDKIKETGIAVGFELLKSLLIQTAKDQLKQHGFNFS